MSSPLRIHHCRLATAIQRTPEFAKKWLADFFVNVAQRAYWLGMRRGEIFGLCWSMVDLDKAELTVLSETSKCRRWRTLPLVPALVAV